MSEDDEIRNEEFCYYLTEPFNNDANSRFAARAIYEVVKARSNAIKCSLSEGLYTLLKRYIQVNLVEKVIST